MQNSSKAWLVLVGCFGFFGLALFGPGLSKAGEGAVRFVAQSSSGKSPARFAKERAYALDPAMVKAQACCESCAQEWDFGDDRCALVSQPATACYAACGAQPGVPQPVAPHGH
ncbi:MAG: hypothetical protein R3F60_27020 [bacterium]